MYIPRKGTLQQKLRQFSNNGAKQAETKQSLPTRAV